MPMHVARILGVDTGGTMTDTFVVDEKGQFTIGKAQSTPDRESEGLMHSLRDALHYWSLDASREAKNLNTVVYSGTSMLNRLLERRGESRIGVIVTSGFEDYLQMERAVQTYAGYGFSDRLHTVTHIHNDPLVPRHFVRGVRERVSFFGEEVIPLYENEVRQAVQDLLRQDMQALCVSLLYSYRDPSHEIAVETIARQVMAEQGREVPIYLSSRSNPIRGDLPRLNTLLVEVYAARPSRQQLFDIRDRVRSLGSPAPVRVLTSYGGTVSPEVEWLATTLTSGPIGGLLGSHRMADIYGFQNVVCTDVGGTSFDVGMITEKELMTRTEPIMARMLLTLPSLAMDSIGAGTGTMVRVDRAVSRLSLGPDSAGYRLGMCYPEGKISVPTVTDCDVLLGYLNPDYFLGGDVKIDVERAYQGIEEQIAKPLGTDVYEAAEGVVRLVETQMRHHLHGMVLGLGYSPENYQLLSYGGGGPLHVAGYVSGLNFQDVLIPSWAAAFSAFGAASADYAYRADRSVDVLISERHEDRTIAVLALADAWMKIHEQISEEFRRDGLDPETMRFIPSVRMQYVGMLDDLEVRSPGVELDPGEDIDQLIRSFDDLFARIFTRSARSAELGYFVTKAIGVGIRTTEKPVIPTYPLTSGKPSSRAHKGTRRVYWDRAWHTADLWEMDDVKAGQEVDGPAVIEAPATTLLVPPGYRVTLDQYRVFHLKQVR